MTVRLRVGLSSEPVLVMLVWYDPPTPGVARCLLALSRIIQTQIRIQLGLDNVPRLAASFFQQSRRWFGGRASAKSNLQRKYTYQSTLGHLQLVCITDYWIINYNFSKRWPITTTSEWATLER